MRRVLAAVVVLASCAAPAEKSAAALDLRVCVPDAAAVEAWGGHFALAVALEPREGRECDFTARAASILNAGKVTLRSAYDGAVIAEIDGTVELVPRLAALSLAPGSEPYEKLKAQRRASGFVRQGVFLNSTPVTPQA